MAYYMVRLYSGSSDRPPEQVLRDVNPKILPKLQEAGGLVRFISFVADDGRIGSASVYEDKEAAHRGLQRPRSGGPRGGNAGLSAFSNPTRRNRRRSEC
jgi:hypothetical protein